MFARRLTAPSNMALYLSGVHSYVALFSFQRSSASRMIEMKEVHRSSRRLVYLNKLTGVCQALFFEILLRGGREPSRPLNSLFSISHSPLLVKEFFYIAKKNDVHHSSLTVYRITSTNGLRSATNVSILRLVNPLLIRILS